MLFTPTNIKVQTGSTFPELIFIIPIFFFMVGGIFEVTYAYRTKSTLNVATFEAAREGAVTNAQLSTMKRALSENMSPLFMEGNNVAQAILEAIVFEGLISSLSPGTLDSLNIISPTRAMFDRFNERVPTVTNRTNRTVQFTSAIPNDNLLHRNTGTVTVGGTNINIQDANLIKVKSLWCHKLRVPGLRELFRASILTNRLIINNALQDTCNAIGVTNGGVYIALVSQAVVRAQSPIYQNDLPN